MNDYNPKLIGIHIRKLRQHQNLSQIDLAKAADINVIQISHFESQERIPSPKNIVKIAKALRCGISFLFFGESYDPGADLRGLTSYQKYLVYELIREFDKVNNL